MSLTDRPDTGDRLTGRVDPGISHMSWPVIAFLMCVLYMSDNAPASLTFTTSQNNLKQNELSNEERVEHNISLHGGSQRRQLGLVLIGLFGIWSFLTAAQTRYRLQSVWSLVFLGFIIWVLASVAWSQNPSTTLRRVFVLFLFVTGALGIATRYSHTALLKFALVSVVLMTLAGLGSELVFGTFRPWQSSYRFAGITWPVFTAWNLTIAILAALALYPRLNSTQRSILLFAIVFAFGLILLTRTRAAVAAAFAGVTVFVVLTSSRKAMFWLAASTVTFVTFFGLISELAGYDLFDKAYHAVNLGRAESARGLSGRAELWEDLFGYIGLRPYLGYGYETFWTSDTLYKIGQKHWGAPDAHNGYINLSLGAGVIGASLYFFTAFGAFVRAIVLTRVSDRRYFAFAAGTLMVMFVNAMFVSTQLATSLYSFLTLTALMRLLFVRTELVVTDTSIPAKPSPSPASLQFAT